MTTVAMIFGMLPVAFGVGEGAETRSPMGVSVIGGLLTSLFLTLAVVPAAYDLFDDGQEWLRRGEFRKLATLDYWRMRIGQIPAAIAWLRRLPRFLAQFVKGLADRVKRRGKLPPSNPA
jgi:hypothetical protein